MRRKRGDFLAAEANRAPPDDEAHDRFQGRRLPDAVPAEEPDRFTWLDRERDALEDVALAIKGL